MSAHRTAAQLLAAYDEQLREEADVDGALDVTRHGPLWLVRLTGGRGFVTYRSLEGAEGGEVRRLVGAAVAHFAEDGSVQEVEWKSRGHDIAPGLEETLAEHGFVAEETESIMIGPLEAGYRYLHSDSTRFSRPLLERSGLVAVSTTTPWVWRAGSSGG